MTRSEQTFEKSVENAKTKSRERSERSRFISAVPRSGAGVIPTVVEVEVNPPKNEADSECRLFSRFRVVVNVVSANVAFTNFSTKKPRFYLVNRMSHVENIRGARLHEY